MIYVYAFLGEAPADVPAGGLAGDPLRLLVRGGVVVAAGEVPEAPAADIAALRAHDATVRALCQVSRAVLPARFGSLAPTEDELMRWLEPRLPLLAEALRLVQGCEQMTLRAFGAVPAPAPAAYGTPGVSSEAPPFARPLRDRGAGIAIDDAGPGTRYLRDRSRRDSVPELDPLRRRLDGLIRAERVERPRAGRSQPEIVPPSPSLRTAQSLLASVHHLLPRGRAEQYFSAVEGAAEELRPLRLVATGPWAPYAFAEGLS